MLLPMSFDPACAACPRLYDHRQDLHRRGLAHGPARPRGPRDARLLVVALTPAPPPGERYGGQAADASEDFLVDSLLATGFAKRIKGRPRLEAARITHAARCAPPAGSGPTALELRRCRGYLMHDLALLHTPGMTRTRCVVALGKVAYASVARALAAALPEFEHGVESSPRPHLRVLGCLAPSRRNLERGALTSALMDGVFERCRVLLSRPLPDA